MIQFVKIGFEGIQFTREMAEGTEPVPRGVIFCSRRTDRNGKFPDYADDGVYLKNFETCHRHIFKSLTKRATLRVEIGDWIITETNGTQSLIKPTIFADRFKEANG